jgi:hypothetical protein
MNSNIQFLYKHQAGTRTIQGIFPVYVYDKDLCKIKESKTKQQKDFELLYEGDPATLLASESEDNNIVELIIDVDGVDYTIYIE